MTLKMTTDFFCDNGNSNVEEENQNCIWLKLMITALSLVNFTTDEKAGDCRGRDASEAFLRLEAVPDLTAVQCQCHGSESAPIMS